MYLFMRQSSHRAMGRHLPYGITQCYLPPETSECTPPPLTPASKLVLKGMEGRVDVCYPAVHWPGAKLATSRSQV